MKLSFGVGIVFVPFGLLIPTQYVLAASYASRLSDIVSGAIATMSLASQGLSVAPPDEQPVPAVSIDEAEDLAAVESADATDAERGRISTPKKGKARNGNRSTQAAKAHELPAIFIPADRVLKLANAGARPSGRAVTPDRARPAGVQVFGASSLGVGVRDGDVITRVSGVPVGSASQIIGLVIAARGARQPVIVAEIYRGQRSYILSVEQPYLPVGASPRSADSAASKP